jgi:hypothetical protein
VEREAPTERELAAVQDELNEVPDGSPLGQVYSSGSYGQRGVVDVQVAVVTPEAQAFVEERWGDLVELHGSLQPVVDP